MQHDASTPGATFSSFVPLILIALIVIGATAGAGWYYASTDTAFLMRVFMGTFFLIFGALKVVKWRDFVDAYQSYDLIAAQSRFYGYLYPIIELSLGAAYLAAHNLPLTNTVTLVVMLVSAAGVANELRKGSVIPCACLGTVFKLPMTYVTLGEDLLMAAMAAWMLLL